MKTFATHLLHCFIGSSDEDPRFGILSWVTKLAYYACRFRLCRAMPTSCTIINRCTMNYRETWQVGLYDLTPTSAPPSQNSSLLPSDRENTPRSPLCLGGPSLHNPKTLCPWISVLAPRPLVCQSPRAPPRQDHE
jgi:hypothetical protein